MFLKKKILEQVFTMLKVFLLWVIIKKYKIKNRDFPNARFYGENSISLPLHQKINEKIIKFICSKINEK